jgi:prepilin-type N-terminal cleavage/methylation domain-containing protein/prepilin-type processing-associated H-X9-DG protein
MRIERRRGFTLIELLVVVAIIALLIAILLPSLGRAKASGVRVKCASALRQWGTVINMYAQENDNVFGNKMGQPWNNAASGPYVPYWASKFNQQMRSCPGDPAANVTNTTLYSMVRYIPVKSNKTSWKFSEFKYVNDTLLMIDSTGDSGNNWSFNLITDPHVKAPEMPEALMNRHMGVGNAMFLDTHVEAVKYADYQNNIPANVNETFKRWTFLSRQ